MNIILNCFANIKMNFQGNQEKLKIKIKIKNKYYPTAAVSKTIKYKTSTKKFFQCSFFIIVFLYFNVIIIIQSANCIIKKIEPI